MVIKSRSTYCVFGVSKGHLLLRKKTFVYNIILISAPSPIGSLGTIHDDVHTEA